MAYDGPVKIREGNLNQLIALYEATYVKLVQEITTATDHGKIRKARVMARIDYELGLLGVDVEKWARSEIPQYYLDGANVAQQDLRALGVDISKRNNFAVINKEAIAALTDEVGTAFGQSMSAISRNVRSILSDALKQQISFTIAQGKLTGDARKTVSRNVAQILDEKGLSALQDKSGRNWTFENYARMLVRTKAAEARNQGLANRMLTSGYDLVQVSNHNSKHPACRALEGKILSLTGDTPRGTKLPGGYVVWGSLTEAIAAGLFHPNCQHAINVIKPSLAAKTQAYDNPYNKLSAAERAKADLAFINRNRSAAAIAAHPNGPKPRTPK